MQNYKRNVQKHKEEALSGKQDGSNEREGDIQSSLHQAKGATGQHEAFQVKPRHEHLRPLAYRAKHVFLGHAHVLKPKRAPGWQRQSKEVMDAHELDQSTSGCGGDGGHGEEGDRERMQHDYHSQT